MCKNNFQKLYHYLEFLSEHDCNNVLSERKFILNISSSVSFIKPFLTQKGIEAMRTALKYGEGHLSVLQFSKIIHEEYHYDESYRVLVDLINNRHYCKLTYMEKMSLISDAIIEVIISPLFRYKHIWSFVWLCRSFIRVKELHNIPSPEIEEIDKITDDFLFKIYKHIKNNL